MRPVKDLPEALSTRLGGTKHLWCEECHRTFVEDDVAIDDATFDKATMYVGGSPNLDRLADAVMMRARCAYQDCNVPLRVQAWSTLRSRSPEFPEVPEDGVRYEIQEKDEEEGPVLAEDGC
ncbi:MAG: hypothetical protein GX604_10490 [Actinobacteria bacterium]|nr:hypothetical protein [Actinomycetota bacterium]